MRWSTPVLSVTLFYSLSFVNAIPHDVDEKRYWLHRRQGPSGSSLLSSIVSDPSPSAGSQGISLPAASSTTLPITHTPSSEPSPSSSSSTPTPPATSRQPSESSSPSTFSSSSSTSSSSSSSSTSTSTGSSTSLSSTPTVTNHPNTQVSTSYRRFSSTVDLPSNTLTSDGNVGTGSGSSFLKNKAAMGSTFAIIGLIGVAIIVGAVFFLIKKVRQRKDEDELDTYFEKLPANHSNNTNSRDIGGGNDYGLGPSATDLTVTANNQTYMSRDVHYGATSQYPNQFANYAGFEYPPERGSVVEPPISYAPGTAYAVAMSQRGQYHYQGQAEDPNTVPNHPFADPDNRRY